MKGWRLFVILIVGMLTVSSGVLFAAVAIGSTKTTHEISYIASRTDTRGWLWDELMLLDVDTLTTTKIRNIDDVTWTPDGSSATSLNSARWTTGRENELVLYDMLRGFITAEIITVDNLPSDEPAIVSSVWSPDGSHLAFTLKTFNSFNDLYVYTPATGTSQNLTQTPKLSEDTFVWSPDGRTLAYTNKNAELWVVTLGEAPRQLPIKVADPVRMPLWSLDSASLLVKAAEGTAPATRVNISDGTQTALSFCAMPEDPKYTSKLAWHPDGHLTCTTRDKKTRLTDIVLVDLAANTSMVIGQEQAVVDNLAWSSDGQYLVYQADSTTLGFNVMAYDEVAHHLTRVIRLEGGKAVWRPHN